MENSVPGGKWQGSPVPEAVLDNRVTVSQFKPNAVALAKQVACRDHLDRQVFRFIGCQQIDPVMEVPRLIRSALRRVNGPV